MKEKRSMLKGYALGLLTALLVAAMVVPGFAATVAKTITVYTGINLYYDGVKVEPKDAAGKKVEPLLYNGTTYLPVRAVSGLFGEDINWDGATQSVYIGDMPGKTTYLADLKAYDNHGVVVWKTMELDGKNYPNSLLFARAYMGEEVYAIWNLNGAYDTLEFDLGHQYSPQFDKQLLIYLDGRLAETVKLGAGDLVRHVTVDLDGALRMEIRLDSNSSLGLGSAVLK